MSLLRIYTDVPTAKRELLKRYAPDEIDVPDRIKASLHDMFGQPTTPAEAVRAIRRERLGFNLDK